MAQRKGRILSVQSHVAYGYVGGKAAVFPLQCLAYDVDVVNTVNFSNHSGYARLGGTRTSAAELTQIFEGMRENGLLRPDRLLTGYIPGAEAVQAVKALAEQLRQSDPELIYLLDPVLGDSGKLYVSPDVLPIYRAALPLATIITPNWFEVELLTETKLTDLASLRTALRILHETYHVPHVVISSLPLRPWLTEHLPSSARPPSHDDVQSYLACIASTRGAGVAVATVPCLPGYFTGVGDLFSALVLAHFHDGDLARAAQRAVSQTHAVLALTHTAALALPEAERPPTDEEADAREPARRVRRMRGRELRVVQGQDIIRGTAPIEEFRMEPWAGFWDA